jgi:hypothetical protein
MFEVFFARAAKVFGFQNGLDISHSALTPLRVA